MTYGFTGTQGGMTDAQRKYLKVFLGSVKDPWDTWFHHGDCIGADHDFHRLVRQFEGKVHLHPPDKNIKRAFCDFNERSWPLPYLTRNRHIVLQTDLMIATPGEMEEQVRSGTWSTIRYAKKISTPVLIVYPDGSHEEG